MVKDADATNEMKGLKFEMFLLEVWLKMRTKSWHEVVRCRGCDSCLHVRFGSCKKTRVY
jgi:hypothetical protein